MSRIKDLDMSFLKEYYPEYNPENFGCSYNG